MRMDITGPLIGGFFWTLFKKLRRDVGVYVQKCVDNENKVNLQLAIKSKLLLVVSNTHLLLKIEGRQIHLVQKLPFLRLTEESRTQGTSSTRQTPIVHLHKHLVFHIIWFSATLHLFW